MERLTTNKGMTEQEAARYLQALTFNIVRRKLPRDTETINIALEAVVMGMHALKEIQQYRALGTTEELQELKEKQIPKKPIFVHFLQENDGGGYMCPACKNGTVLNAYGDKSNNCPYCGQALDWSN